MGLATYTQLLAKLATTLGRADLSSDIPDFVTLAQIRVARDVRAQAMETKSTSFTINAEYVNVPSDFLELRHFYITSTNPNRVLRYMTPDQMTDEYPSNDTGETGYFAVVGSQFRLAPAPNATFTATLVYHAKPATLATTTQETNSLLPSNADLYYYGALLEAEAHIGNDPRLPVWKEFYAQAVSGINRSSNNSRHGGPMAARPG